MNSLLRQDTAANLVGVQWACLPLGAGSFHNQERQTTMEESMEMPKYRSHKTVWAMKITGIEPQAENGTTGLLCETPEGFKSRIAVTQEYQSKHKPEVGGYYVQYQDGYKSFSPAQAFDEGYTRI